MTQQDSRSYWLQICSLNSIALSRKAQTACSVGKSALYPIAIRLSLLLLLVSVFATSAIAQRSSRNQKRISGTVTAINPGEITIKPAEGDSFTYKIQDKSDRAISIAGRPTRFPAKINVHGRLPIRLIETGMIVSFQNRCNVYGKAESDLNHVDVIQDDASPELNVEFLERPEQNSDFAKVEIVGRVNYIKGKRFQIQVPKAKWAKNERMTFNVNDETTFSLGDDSLSRVQPGDRVTNALVVQLTEKDWAVYDIDIELNEDRETLSTEFEDKLENKFSHLSDEPGKPRDVRSAHFILKTDVSDRSAQVLLAKLETMHQVVSGYFRTQPRQPIQCYVIRDLSQWNLNELDPNGVAKIREPAGVTISRRLGNQVLSIVYSCDNHGVVQHEAVHAFCFQTFGSTGPVWYAEGMAEMGNYWKPGQLEVNIDPIVISYLTGAPPKKLKDIIAAGQISGDSWQAYAWRWALCHLLASNPNYARRFKTLGVNLMNKNEDSFEIAFGEYKDAISFEYDQFVENFGNGYRVDLCVWDWKTKASKLSPGKRTKRTIKAASGWQATKLMVAKGDSIDFVADGKWKVNSIVETNANGNSQGLGKLVGVVFKDFQLSEPFELGDDGTFIAPMDGQLFVRCKDDWTSLGDNEGTVVLHLRKTPKKKE